MDARKTIQELGKKHPHTPLKLNFKVFKVANLSPKNILKETRPAQMIQSAGSKYPGETRGFGGLIQGPNLQICFFQWWILANHSSGGGWVALRATDHEANGWNGGPTDVFTDVKSHIERSSDFFRKNTWDFFLGAIFFREIEHESRIAMFCSSL